MVTKPFSVWAQAAVLVAVALAGVLVSPRDAAAQALADLKTPDTPLVLKAQGSFFVGGETVEQTAVELGGLGPGGHVTVNQMYVRYMIPHGGDRNVPVVMLHGATLTGKSWETTPDGRMGWDEYFVRKGHPVYVPDQVGRGRSGFNQAALNAVRAGTVPVANLPPWLRFSDEVVWPNFRFGAKPGLFHKAIVESGGSRDSVLTARPMREDGVDPNYPVSAETIGITFARSMGIEGTDQAALASLRALSAEQVLRGPAAPTGAGGPPIETTPILDGKLVTETAETAYKARRQPRVPLLLGSNSADTAGNRIRATTKEQLFARFGKWSAQAKAAYDPDGTTDLATLVSRANNDFGQAEPARFAANAFAANGSPVYLYRFSYVQTSMREQMRAGAPHGGEIAYVFGTLSAGRGGAPTPEDQAVARMAQSYWVNFAKSGDPNGAGLPAWPRHEPSKDVIFEFGPDGSAGAGPDPWKARLDVTQLNTESGKRSDY